MAMADRDDEDPPRILSGHTGAPASLVRELEAARSEPDARQLEALGQMLAATLAATGAPGVPPAAPAASAASSGAQGIGLKLVIASVVVLGGIGGYVAWRWLDVPEPTAEHSSTP